MSTENMPARIRLVPAAFVIGLSLIFCTVVAGHVVMQTRASSKTIRVKGYAEKRISSDYGIWSAHLTARSPQLPQAYEQVRRDTEKLAAWLVRQGVPTNCFTLSAVSIESQRKRDDKGHETGEIETYTLQQSVTVRLPDVRLVDAVSKEVSTLIKDGVELSSGAPEYYFTGLEGLKIEMLGEATKDAGRRARTIVSNTGARLGTLRSAQQGVFQITPVYSTEVSGYGELDTSSIDKTIKAVVDAEFGVE